MEITPGMVMYNDDMGATAERILIITMCHFIFGFKS